MTTPDISYANHGEKHWPLNDAENLKNINRYVNQYRDKELEAKWKELYIGTKVV